MLTTAVKDEPFKKLFLSIFNLLKMFTCFESNRQCHYVILELNPVNNERKKPGLLKLAKEEIIFNHQKTFLFAQIIS